MPKKKTQPISLYCQAGERVHEKVRRLTQTEQFLENDRLDSLAGSSLETALPILKSTIKS